MSRPNRKIKVTLTVQVDADDPSVLAGVRVVAVDGIKLTLDPACQATVELVTGAELPAPRVPMERLETDAREAIQAELVRRYEEFLATGKEPAFDGGVWNERLRAVWEFLKAGATEGYKVAVGEFVKLAMKRAGLDV